jgi:hypothetical protein
VIGQPERPETIIIPVSSMGDVSDTRKQILQNTLTDELKKHFRIVPQEKYKQVLEQVFQELEYEECSEDVCIMRVQEMLQVENVFNLQIIGEGTDSQLNLKWVTLDEKRNEEDYCEGCGTGELRKMIGGLVEKLVGEKRVEVVVQKKPVVVVEKKVKGVLYELLVDGEFGWYKSGDEKKDIKYVGEIINGKPNGQGKLTYPIGSKYVGEHKDGEMSGQGTYTWSDGSKYVGEFKDDKFHGQGTLTRPNGYKYVGEFKDGKYRQGTETLPDGIKYVGEWKEEKKHGQGTVTWPNGDMLIAEFKDGEAHGQGTKIWNDGRNYIGEFKEGGYWTGTLYYNYSGKIPESYVNGIKQ